MAFSLVAFAALSGAATPARADETDNFTCRAARLADSREALDGWVNTRIAEAISRANRTGPGTCDLRCVQRELQRHVGANSRHPLTLIPHSALARWAGRAPGVNRCRLAFRDSIYGARPYHQPWLFPLHGRVIFLADTISLSGETVGLDKIDHFMREGLAHWREVRSGRDIGAVLAREIGPSGRPFLFTERGLKGLALTGVFAWADLAAGYAGYRFWGDLLDLGGPEALVAFDPIAGRYIQVRPFTFSDYVTSAWDETVNCSTFDRRLSRDVSRALERRTMRCPLVNCRRLAVLPDGDLYVSPLCRTDAAPPASSHNERSACHPVVPDDVAGGRAGDGRQLAERRHMVSGVHLHRPSPFAAEDPAKAVGQTERIGREWRREVRGQRTEQAVAGESDAHARAQEEAVRPERPQLHDAEDECRPDRILIDQARADPDQLDADIDLGIHAHAGIDEDPVAVGEDAGRIARGAAAGASNRVAGAGHDPERRAGLLRRRR
jgi:hypothetical protein